MPAGFFVLRTPLLPFDELVGWAAGVEAPAAPGDAGALARDRELLRDRLRRFLERAEVREAILVASPELESLIDTWTAHPDSARGRKCERSLARYAARMAGRPTPFGLFAGLSVGTIGDKTDLALGGRDGYRRHTRLDAAYLVDVLERLLAEPQVREGLGFHPNPSLYRIGERWRFVRSMPGAADERHVLVSVRDSPTLRRTLEAAGGGGSRADLIDAVTETGAEPVRAGRYVDQLIDQRVVVPAMDLQLTGADATYGLGDRVPALARARTELAGLDAEPLGVPRSRYERVASVLEGLPAAADLGGLLQVDMTKPGAHATLGQDVVAEIRRGVDLLRRVTTASDDWALRRFVEGFRDRYESRPVPLLEALDPDLGVAFDDAEGGRAPLLAGLADAAERTPTTWGPREEYLLGRLVDLQGHELVLDAGAVERLEPDEASVLPDACAALAAVAASSSQDLARGRFRVLVATVHGPPGALTLSRFCHTDATLRAAVEAHLGAEERLDPDAVFAEVVHLPAARTANIVARPVLREYELECFGRSGAPPERRLSLDDILVSLEGDRVVLWSRRLGRRVVPRMSSAHNFPQHGAATYRFLCSLARQGFARKRSFWGPLAASPFLPRVRWGRIVLELARWRITEADLGGPGDLDADHRAVQQWRASRHIPRFVALSEREQGLPVDLDNALLVDSLVHAVRTGGSATLMELFPTAGELCAHGPEGAFRHELVVPFVRSQPRPAPPRRRPADTDVQRRFPPGSEWLYARIYTSRTSADAVLAGTVAPLARTLLDARVADRWFFLRYGDPEHHLRVRFHGDPGRLHAEAVPAVQAAGAELLDSGLAWRIEFGTYEREVERYGGPAAIELAERVFHADSEAVVALLPMLEPGNDGQEERWRIGLCGAHMLLADLGLDEPERLVFARWRRDALRRVQRLGPADGKRIGERFRRERTGLVKLLDGAAGPLETGLEILRERSRALAPAAGELAALEREDRLTMTRQRIAASLVHMHLNRLLRRHNSAQEAVIYEFLARLYEARERRRSPGPPG